MKKLFLALATISFLISCHKQERQSVESDISKKNVQENSHSDHIFLKELSEKDLSDFLKPHKNDTLYITNFFATWCGPCMVEIPHFQKEMEELKGQKVKFTFVSLDQKDDWNTEVKKFAIKKGLENHIVVFDIYNAQPDFAKNNTKTWDGGSVPFTFFSKGNRSIEFIGTLSESALKEKINSLK